MILIAKLCKSGTIKHSLISQQALVSSTFLTVCLVVNFGGKLSEVASIEMNTNTFLFKPAKQISELYLRGHILSLPTLLCRLE